MIDAFVQKRSAPPISHASAAMGADRTRVIVSLPFHHGWDRLPRFKERFSDFFQPSVDLLFVIGGFITVFVTSERAMTAGQFLKILTIRMVPLYWLATIAASFLLLVLPGLFRSNELTVGHFVLSMLFVAHPNPVAPSSASPIIELGWTLEYVVFFYARFAASPSRRVWISASRPGGRNGNRFDAGRRVIAVHGVLHVPVAWLTLRHCVLPRDRTPLLRVMRRASQPKVAGTPTLVAC
jgi:hypothetical protein